MHTRTDKDIVRTDRDYPFFSEEKNLDELRDILVTFITYNQDLGYTQGMNDLCAIIYNVLQGDEVATFWCFANLMERLGPHFRKDQIGMTTTLRALARVLNVVDPELYHYLGLVTHLFSGFTHNCPLTKHNTRNCGLGEHVLLLPVDADFLQARVFV